MYFVESCLVINYFQLTGGILSRWVGGWVGGWGGGGGRGVGVSHLLLPEKKYGETWGPIVKFSVARHKMVIS